jgi:hypothetical protein
MLDLCKTLKEALLGPVGTFYLSKRPDFLFDSGEFLWNKFILPVYVKMDMYAELRS